MKLVVGSVLLATACCRVPSPMTPTVNGSVGAPAHGVLVRGEALPLEGLGFQCLKSEGQHHGVARLVHAIEDAAADVARSRPGGAPLVVGDLSGPSGGKIPGHRSHRSGRDANLLYFALTPAGEPIKSPGFVRYGADGLAEVGAKLGGPPFIRLDVPRQWLLVKALVQSSDANVQWLFTSRAIEALLVEHARALGEDPNLIWRAEVVMKQPSDSLPHDDHMHLRTACTSDEVLAGCEGGGPYWPWLAVPPPPPADDDDELLAALLLPLRGLGDDLGKILGRG